MIRDGSVVREGRWDDPVYALRESRTGEHRYSAVVTKELWRTAGIDLDQA